ncbi:Integrator complex subunit 1 [Nymphon striatum]|nr:Integrator complex subunit 1 [Nymphon striatum]
MGSDGTSESMPWLVDLVASSSGSFEMLPRQCLCEFLLHESLDRNESETGDKVEKAKYKLKQKIQVELLQYVKTLLFDSSADSKPSVEIIEYFLQRLYCKQASSRVLAAKSLQMVLCHSSEMEDDVETDLTMDHDDKEILFGWVSQLTLLPHFKDIKRTTGECLRQACTVENNPVAVGAYIKFLSCYHPADTLQDLSDLSLDVANVLVNRTTLINTLMPLTSNNPAIDYSVQNAFIRIFISYLPRALKIDKEAFSWSISQDQILVQWSNGYTATMHIFVAHAMVVLLSYGPPADNPKYFESLLEYWFPSEGDPPQAFLVDTSELALLLPDWLKLRMLSSKVVRLVDAALKDLEPNQLVLFVQSFGIPVETVSKLLSALDTVAQIDSKSIKQAVVDKPYMCQLVDVQQQRGAVSGNKFVSILSEYKEADESEVEIKPEIMDSSISQSTKLRDKPLEGSIISNIFKLFNPSNSSDSQRAIFDSFMKKIGSISIKKQTNSFIPEIQLQMTEALLSSNGKNLIIGLHKYLCYSCALFSVIYRCQSDEARMTLYLPLIETIINQSFNCKSPLLNLLSKHSANLLVTAEVMRLKSANTDKDARLDIKAKGFWRRGQTAFFDVRVTHVNSQTNANKDTKVVFKEHEQSKKREYLERVLEIEHASFTPLVFGTNGGVKVKLDQTEEEKLKMLKGNWNEKNTSELVTRLISLLKDSIENCNDSHRGQLGMFADWLKLIEPEIVKSCPDLEKDLLFSQFTSKSNDLSLSSRRQYLLALVIHHTNWSTIYRTINLCLNVRSSSKLNPSSVLDFLWAFVDIPRLWQGQNKNKSKHSDSSNVLALTVPQLLCVMDYVVREASPVSLKHLEQNFEENARIISLRLPLLLHCLNNQPDLVTAAVNYMMTVISGEDKMKSNVARNILIRLYTKLPHIIFKTKHEKIKFNLDDISITEAGVSSLDVFSHNVLSALASIGPDQKGKQRLHDLEMECRKMTASHPLLVLRQLPMIAASLHGRVNFEFSVFTSRNHLAYFTIIMGLLELMKPYIFHQRFQSSLQNIFAVYFEFIQAFSIKNKLAVPLTQRIIKFLSDYINSNCTKDCQIASKYSTVLEALAKKYPDLPYLQSVMRNKEIIPLESRMSIENNSLATVSTGRSGSKSNVEYSANYTRAQLSPILTQLSSKCSNDILSALYDLSNIAQRNPAVIKPAFDELKKLLFTSNIRCREVTYELVLIHLKNDPNCSSEFLPVYLSCLDSEDADVMLTALEHSAEVVILSQEYAKELLDRIFSLGISYGIDIKPYFVDILLLLKMQNGI